MLITSCPPQRGMEEERKRHLYTTVLTTGMTTSYVIYYLSMRVSSWWVSLGILCITWLNAGNQPLSSRNYLVATSQNTGEREHWTGLMRDTVSESLIATLEFSQKRPIPPSKSTSSTPPGTPGISLPTVTSIGDTLLFIDPAIGKSLSSWSGVEDVMKVSLEIAKRAWATHQWAGPHRILPDSGRWKALL